MKKIEFADFMQKTIGLIPNESLQVQKAVAMAMRAEYFRGIADEALDSLDRLEER